MFAGSSDNPPKPSHTIILYWRLAALHLIWRRAFERTVKVRAYLRLHFQQQVHGEGKVKSFVRIAYRPPVVRLIGTIKIEVLESIHVSLARNLSSFQIVTGQWPERGLSLPLIYETDLGESKLLIRRVKITKLLTHCPGQWTTVPGSVKREYVSRLRGVFRPRMGTDPPNQNIFGGRLSSAKYWPILAK